MKVNLTALLFYISLLQPGPLSNGAGAQDNVIDNETPKIPTTTTKNTVFDSIVADDSTPSSSSSGNYNWLFLSVSVFSVFGVMGNLLVCLTIKRDHSLQTKTNYYLFSLAITDMAICVIVIPLAIVQDFSSNPVFLLFFFH